MNVYILSACAFLLLWGLIHCKMLTYSVMSQVDQRAGTMRLFSAMVFFVVIGLAQSEADYDYYDQDQAQDAKSYVWSTI